MLAEVSTTRIGSMFASGARSWAAIHTGAMNFAKRQMDVLEARWYALRKSCFGAESRGAVLTLGVWLLTQSELLFGSRQHRPPTWAGDSTCARATLMCPFIGVHLTVGCDGSLQGKRAPELYRQSRGK